MFACINLYNLSPSHCIVSQMSPSFLIFFDDWLVNEESDELPLEDEDD